MLDLLLVAGERVLVPRAVLDEIETYGSTDITVQVIDQTSWLEIVEPIPFPDVITGLRLGRGESAVLTWALAHPGCAAILDDRDARMHAGRLGVPHVGTLGLIVDAKARGSIEQAEPAIEQVRRAGLYLSDRLVRETLVLLGE